MNRTYHDGHISSLFAGKLESLKERMEQPTTKHEHEFQEVCEDLATDFGKGVWALPHKPGFTEWKLKEAGRIARARGITKIAYLIGIMKRL